MPLTADEAGYAYVAHWMARGAVLYRDLWFDRPQAIFGLYAAIFAALGTSVEAIRTAAAIYNALTAVALGVLGSRLFGRRAGVAAALAFAAGSAAPTIEGFTANGELFMNLPVVGALLLACARRPFAAGALLALAAAVKPTALPTAAPALVALLCTAYAGKGAGRRLVAAAAGATAGGLAGAAPFVVHGITEGGVAAYWYSVAGFRLEAHSAFSAGGRFVDELRQTGPHVFFGLLPLWLAGGWWTVRVLRRRLASGGCTRSEAAVLLYLGGSLAGAALGGYWYWHYFTGVLPALALAAGVVVTPLASGPAWRALRRRAALAAGASAALGGALAYNLAFVGGTPEDTSWRLYRNAGYVAGREVAAYLRERTSPDDTVFAAFSQPDLYYLSGRRSAGVHLYWTEINRVPGALDAVLSAIDDPRRCPKYVVRVQAELERPGRAAAFWERVERRFAPEVEIRGLVLYRRADDYP